MSNAPQQDIKFKITFNVPEQDQIKLLEILSDELIDTELMNEESGSIKCRFAILTPAAWINWIKGQIGLDITKNDVHVNKDESKVFIRFFSLGTDSKIFTLTKNVLEHKVMIRVVHALSL